MPRSLESPLRRFISLQQEKLLVLGPRRIPPLPCPGSNTDTAMSIVTSVGFAKLESAEYVEAVRKLQPDIVLGMGDVVIGQKPSQKREEKMGDRTQVWVKELADGLKDLNRETPQTAIFAPILPLEAEKQLFYLSDLKDGFKQDISGLVLYEARSVIAIPENLLHLPRLCIENLESPHDVLSNIAIGIDLFTLPFIGVATDAGIALNFTFPLETSMESEVILPLGIDMWSPAHAIDLSPLRQGCNCYACLNHHRAYLQHLLGAKEMVGWVLLQIHNHQVLEDFFGGVRKSLEKRSFPDDRILFAKSYEPNLPARTGQGPRVRGYQFKSEGKGEPRKNVVAYRSLDDGKEKFIEAVPPNPDIDVEGLEEKGFAERVG